MRPISSPPNDILAANPTRSPSDLATPAQLRAETPLTLSGRANVKTARRAISRILSGEDDKRLIIVCGPCSVHDINSAVEYGSRLRKLSRKVEDKLLLVMRTYFEKPRSVIGWKGFFYDPELDGSGQANVGLQIARRLLVRLNEIGLPCATEFLNPVLAPYIEDTIAYGAIGSRTAESQIHRELASRLQMPVGLKNSMDGRIQSAVDGVKAAREQHYSFSIDDSGQSTVSESPGNPFAHPLLRGGHDGPNYDKTRSSSAAVKTKTDTLRRPVMIDCSHGNSEKDHRRQAAIAKDIAHRFAKGEHQLAGLMLESNLIEGNQPPQRRDILRYGQSITDSCIGWEETENVITQISNAL